MNNQGPIRQPLYRSPPQQTAMNMKSPPQQTAINMMKSPPQ